MTETCIEEYCDLIEKIEQIGNIKLNGGYYADKIRKSINPNIKKRCRNLGIKEETYQNIVDLNFAVISHFYNSECYKIINKNNNELVKKIIEEIYRDPDNIKTKEYEIEKNKSITLSLDGIVSKNNLQKLFPTIEWINEYKIIRDEKYAKIFWPRERPSINTLKVNCFKDRIDYTLYDIKIFFECKQKINEIDKLKKEIESNCTLKKAFTNQHTLKWLCSFNNFEDFIDKMDLKIFVFQREDPHYEVLNIENLDKSESIDAYCSNYEWSEKYYFNLKKILGIDCSSK